MDEYVCCGDLRSIRRPWCIDRMFAIGPRSCRTQSEGQARAVRDPRTRLPDRTIRAARCGSERVVGSNRTAGSSDDVAGIVIGAVPAAYVVFKWWERQRFYRALRMARITVAELYELSRAGVQPSIIDVRSPTACAGAAMDTPRGAPRSSARRGPS